MVSCQENVDEKRLRDLGETEVSQMKQEGQ